MTFGGGEPPVRDALHRPITAGGFVDNAPVIFTDITKQSGPDKLLHRSGSPEKSTILDAPGFGVGLMPMFESGRMGLFYLGLEIPHPEQPLRYFGRRCP